MARTDANPDEAEGHDRSTTAHDRGTRSSLTAPRSWLAAGTLVAAVATVGSLWFSLGLGLVPCRLCWYQRILMYPLVVVLGVATLERRPGVAQTVLPLSVFGGGIAVYHSLLQMTSTQCGFDAACAAVMWRLPLLELTIPNLSLIAFGLITVLMGYLSRSTT